MRHISVAAHEKRKADMLKLLPREDRQEIDRHVNAALDRVGYAQRPLRTAKEFDAMKAAGETAVSGRTLYEGRSGCSAGDSWRDVWLLPCKVIGRSVMWDVKLVIEHEQIVGSLRALGKLERAA